MMMPCRREECRKITVRHFILPAMLLLSILCTTVATADRVEDPSVIVNVMIDCELNPTSHNLTSQEEKALELDSFTKMLDIMDSKN